jgi:hypothetical protein
MILVYVLPWLVCLGLHSSSVDEWTGEGCFSAQLCFPSKKRADVSSYRVRCAEDSRVVRKSGNGLVLDRAKRLRPGHEVQAKATRQRSPESERDPT